MSDAKRGEVRCWNLISSPHESTRLAGQRREASLCLGALGSPSVRLPVTTLSLQLVRSAVSDVPLSEGEYV